MHRLRTFALCLVSLAGSGGCEVRFADFGEALLGTPEDAAAIVERWFIEAQTREGDGGWSLLYPNVHTDMIGSVEAYQEALRTADWTSFDYFIGDVRLHDGEYHVTVRVRGGLAQIPVFMRRWGLIQFNPVDGQLTDAGHMTVRTGAEGVGIQALGGPG